MRKQYYSIATVEGSPVVNSVSLQEVLDFLGVEVLNGKKDSKKDNKVVHTDKSYTVRKA